jgi:thymidylate synthase
MKFTNVKIRYIMAHLYSLHYVFSMHVYKTHVIKLLKLIQFTSNQSQVPNMQSNTLLTGGLEFNDIHIKQQYSLTAKQYSLFNTY